MLLKAASLPCQGNTEEKQFEITPRVLQKHEEQQNSSWATILDIYLKTPQNLAEMYSVIGISKSGSNVFQIWVETFKEDKETNDSSCMLS